MAPEVIGQPSMTSTERGSERAARGRFWWRAKSSSIKENPITPQSTSAGTWTGGSPREHVITRWRPSNWDSSRADSEREEIFKLWTIDEEQETWAPKAWPPGRFRRGLFLPARQVLWRL